MEKTKKMTKKDYYNALIAKYPLTNEEKDFCLHEIELLEKKNSVDKKPTAQQKVNAEAKNTIYEMMEPNRLYSVTEIQKACGIETNQRTSALLHQLKDEGRVARTVDKRKAFFSKVID